MNLNQAVSSAQSWAHLLIWVARHVANRYDEPEATRLQSWLPEDGICIDVGAHAGSWSIPLSRLVPKGYVIAFEALPYYASLLQRTVKVLGRDNIEVVNQAICDDEKSIEIVWKDDHGRRLTGLTHVLGKEEAAANTASVAGTTLDAFLSSRDGAVRFIKFDIEGAELAALRGAEGIMRKQRPVLYTELNPEHCARYGYRPSDVFDFLESRGYQALVLAGESTLSGITTDAYLRSGKHDLWFVPTEDVASFVEASRLREH